MDDLDGGTIGTTDEEDAFPLQSNPDEAENETEAFLEDSSSARSSSSRRYNCYKWSCFGVVVAVMVAGFLLLVLVIGLAVGLSRDSGSQSPYERAVALLTDFPVIDG